MLSDNLVSYWKLDGDSTDSVGDNDGTDTSITYNASYGKINQGGSFSAASNSRIAVGDVAGTSVATVTFSAWVNSNNESTNVDRVIIGYNGWSGNGQFSFELFSRSFYSVYNRALLYVYGSNPDGSGSDDYCSTVDIGDGEWHHVVAILDSANKQISYYIDGTFDTTVTFATALPAISLDNLFLGSWYVNSEYRSFNKYIDEVGIWSRALTSTEITSLYNSGSGLQYPFSTGNATNFFQFI